MTETSYTPRPGSHIYRRADGGTTDVSYQVSGAGVYEGFAGVTDDERLAAEMGQPEELSIADSDAPDAKVVVERILSPISEDPIVVVAPSVPTFGDWEELSTWPTP